MGGHHHARDGQIIDIWRVLCFLLSLKREKVYGDVTLTFRAGDVVGSLKVNQSYLVNDLPEANMGIVQEALRGAPQP